MKNLAKLSALEKAHAIRAGTLTPNELLYFHLQKIQETNSKVNALRFVAEKQARTLAQERTEEVQRGKIRGRLHGLFFCAKDSIDVAGMPRSDGTLHGASEASASNAAAVQRLIDEGAICIGKSNMAEYGKSYYTDNVAFGRTTNPFNREHSPGGSGGGDAAALALDFADIALGSDAGGSIRVPANFCGLFGLIPTRGLISSAGLTHCTHTTAQLFRSLGPLASHLDDLELMNNVLCGYDGQDPYSIVGPLSSQLALNSRAPLNKFAYFSSLNGVEVEACIKDSLKETVEKFRACGFEAEEYCPSAWGAGLEAFIILAAQAALLVEDALERESGHVRDLDKESASIKNLRQRLATELPALNAERALLSWAKIDHLRHEATKVFEKFAFVLSPVAASLAPLHGTNLYQVGTQNLQSQQVFQFASAANILGLPALAFPTSKSATGLPIGLQIIGPRFSEKQMIQVIRQTGCTSKISV